MPLPRNPNSPEFYVYRLVADDVPFYVGIGRSARASDRVRYVRYLMQREARGQTVKWAMSSSAIAALLRAGRDVLVEYASVELTRSQALKAERLEIERLVSDGAVLANIHHNRLRVRNHEQVVSAILERPIRRRL